MKSKIIEVCQPQPINWGKFMLAQFDYNETSYVSAVTNSPLLVEIGYGGDIATWLWVFDLQTGEGAIFPVLNRGSIRHDLDKHKIQVCFLYEPLLEWLYQNYDGDIDKIPGYLEIDAPKGLQDHHRPNLVESSKRITVDDSIAIFCDLEALNDTFVINETVLREAAQAILNLAINFTLAQHYNNLAIPQNILWEVIRQEVLSACYKLISKGVINNFNLLELDTDNTIAGWTIEQGLGKIFVLSLTANGITVSSDKIGLVAQP
jgi:hypothetical protein